MDTRTSQTISLYHGTHRDELVLHPGICLTPDPEIARLYGPNVHTLEMSRADYLSTPHLGNGSIDGDIYVGDDDLDSIDYHIVRYDDMVIDGPAHETVRIITDEGLRSLHAPSPI